MRILMMQVSTCIGSLATLVLRYTFGTARRAGKHHIDVDACDMFDAVPASRRYPCVLIVFWRLATKICPLRASLVRLFAFCVTGPSWPPLAAFSADRGAKRDRAVQERGRRHVLCVRARQMHQRARSGASHGCKWDQHSN